MQHLHNMLRLIVYEPTDHGQALGITIPKAGQPFIPG
jgi:hypothetical protein